MLSLRLDPDIGRRLDQLARKTGRTKSYYVRELIEANLEDLEDRYIAEARLEKRRTRLTSRQVRKALGHRAPIAPKPLKKRVPGIDKGKVWMADNFNAPSD